jgi:outer membrane receptor protein involved in Fe transport
VLVDARIDWKSVGGSNIDLSAYATNLLDSAAIQQINNLYNGLGYDTALYVPPRMIAGSVRFHF